MKRTRRRRHCDPQFGPYDIHTSVNACVMGEVLTPWGESILGGRHGAGVRPVWGRAPGKRGVFLHARLVACGGKGASVRKLGGDRAGEMRISRFLHNRRVTAREIVETAAARTLRAGFRPARACDSGHDLASAWTSVALVCRRIR
jgi:hypothetical protein